MKRFLAVVLVLCLVLGMGSVSAFAEETENTWVTEATMPEGMWNHSSCVVGDNLYVLGSPSSTYMGIYNIKTKQLTTGEPMLEVINVHAAVVAVENKIYAIGSDKMQIYDINTKKWVKQGKPHLDLYHTAVAVGEKIYVERGGVIQIYNIKTDKWTQTAPYVPLKNLDSMSATDGKKIYYIGGSGVSNAMHIYDIETGTWAVGTPMPRVKGGTGIAIYENKIYVLGGVSNGTNFQNDSCTYDIETATWSDGPDFLNKRCWPSVVAVDGKLYASGGNEGGTSYYNTIDSYQIGSIPQESSTKLAVLLSASETVQFSTSYNFANNANFTWTSADETVATVDENGKVTAIVVGETEITAQNGDATFKESIPVKVLEMADEERLAVHLRPQELAKLYLTEDPSTVTWKSFDESVATVDATGQITAVAKGLAIVKAEFGGETYQIYVRVNG